MRDVPAFLDFAATVDAALERARKIQKEHPFAPVAVLCPGGEAARTVARRMAASGKPWLNVRVETLPGLLRRLAEPSLAELGRGLLSEEEACAIVRRALATFAPASPGSKGKARPAAAGIAYFATAAEFDSYTHRFRRLIEELRLNLEDREIPRAIDAAGIGPKGAEILEVVRAYLAGKGSRADLADLVELSPADREHLVLLPETEALLPTRFADWLGAAERAKRLHRIDWIGRAHPPAVDAWRAATTGAEVREALREILRRKSPLDRCLLLVPRDRLDAAQLELTTLGVPFRSAEGVIDVRQAFERFETLLDALETDAAHPAMERHLLAAGKVGALSAYYRMLREGPAQGIDRMLAFLREEARGEEKESGPEGKESGRDKLITLLGELKDLVPLLSRPHDLGEAIRPAIGEGRDARVLSMWCESLRRTDPDIPYDRWRCELGRRMEGFRTAAAGEAHALAVTSVPLAGACDLVFHLGMTEHGFPAQARQDPLLLDGERERINASAGARLVTSRMRNAGAARALDLSLACAGTAWFGSFPKLEPETGRENSPSFHLKELWCARHPAEGRRAGSPDAAWNTLLERERGFVPADPACALLPGEWQIARLLGGDPAFPRHALGIHPEALRHLVDANDAWDAQTVDRPWLVGENCHGELLQARGFSPTDLEKFMECPYKWFLKNELRLRPIPSPASLEAPDPATVGTLVHGMLESCMKRHGAGAGSISGAERDRLLDDALSAWTREHGDLGAFHRKQAAATLLAFLERFLAHERALPPGRKPFAFERTFGRERNSAEGQPLRLKIGGRVLPLSGVIDRIDLNGRTAVVLDYKTGKRKTAHRDFTSPADLSGGAHLQPSLYAEVVLQSQSMKRELSVDAVETGYLPLGDTDKEFIAPYDDAMRDALVEVVDLLFGCLERGFFPRACESDACRFCDYTAVCGPHVTPASRRKLARPKGKASDLAKRWRAIRGTEGEA